MKNLFLISQSYRNTHLLYLLLQTYTAITNTKNTFSDIVWTDRCINIKFDIKTRFEQITKKMKPFSIDCIAKDCFFFFFFFFFSLIRQLFCPYQNNQIIVCLLLLTQ